MPTSLALTPVTRPLQTMRLVLDVRELDQSDVQDALEAFLAQFEGRIFNAVLQVDRHMRGRPVATIRYSSSGDQAVMHDGAPETAPDTPDRSASVAPDRSAPVPSETSLPQGTTLPTGPSLPSASAHNAALNNLLAVLAAASSSVAGTSAAGTSASGTSASGTSAAGNSASPAGFTSYGNSEAAPTMSFSNLPIVRGTGRRGRPRRSLTTTVSSFRANTAATEDEICLICHEEDANKTLACRHMFHKRCLRDVREKTSCPYCRAPVEAF